MGITKREVLLLILIGCLLSGRYLIPRTVSFPDPPITQTVDQPRRCLYVCDKGEIRRMELEQYITGVVLAEMPADFEIEALKAQAIVARTFACKSGKTGKHSDYAVCTDPSCCQGFYSEEDYLKRTQNPAALQKIREAVAQTAGLVVTYENALIEATYFSCSGGYTEDAQAVWGSCYPYLTAKESPGEETAFCFTDEKTVSLDFLMDALNLSLPENPSDWFQNWEYTDGGGVASMTIGGKNFSGTSLRKKLGLRSTAFSVEIMPDSIIFHTRGFGHRVGMSQYGAEAMAVQGKNCEQIISYYYEGTELTANYGET